MKRRSLWILPGIAVGAMFAGSPSIADSSVTVNTNNPQQVIVGFGASDAWEGAGIYYWETPAQQKQIFDLLYSTSNGAGLSIVRHRIPYAIEPAPGVWDWSQDPYIAQLNNEAVSRGVQTTFATPWTMPAWMKSNDDVDNGGQLLPSHYQDYADYLAKYIKYYDSHFYHVDVISLQNEPDITASYDSCTWTSQEFHDFILNYLMPTFQRDGITTTVMMPEMSGWTDSDAYDTLQDPTTADFIGNVAAHQYWNIPPAPFTDAEARGKQIWETEVSNLGGNDPSITDGVYWATVLYDSLVNAHVSAWNYWWLISYNDTSGQPLITASTDGTFYPNKRLFTIGNFSRFVRPGARMVTLSNNNPESGVYVSAYVMEANGNFTFVGINSNATPTNVTVNVPGLTSSSMPAWRTSATENLAQVNGVKMNGQSFTITLAPQSVTTVTGHVQRQLLAPPIQVASGQGAVGSFIADTDFFGGSTYSTTTPVDTSDTVNPAPAALYQNMRWGQFHYIFPGLTPNAPYTVRLHFAETYWTQPGQRLFNVLINKDVVLQEFDVLGAAGGPDKAVTEQFNTTADRFGNITVTFTNGSADNAMVSGIEILPPGG